MLDEKPALPTGTVTFVFSDIEGSTVRWDERREAMQAAVRRHDELMRAAIEQNGGCVFKTIGDAFCAAFGAADDALAATLLAQRGIGAENWDSVGGLRVRMAIHTGIADERDSDYFGPTVNRVARLLAIGYGGQVLVSGATQSLLEHRSLPPQTALHDLGLHRLKDLSAPERVYQLWASDLAGEFPPLRSLDALPNNLPAQLTPMVGRDEELAEIKALVEQSRIVTLLGPGGIGKTRTALQVAADLARDDGAWFVDLASCDDPSLVPSAIAGVFNIADEGGSQRLIERVASSLKTKKLLVVLDNCEHVVAAAAQAVDRLVQGCQDLRVLATSREPIGIKGESLFRMPALPVPPEDGEVTADSVMQFGAAALFVARARAAQQSFCLTDQNAALVAEIVRRLDGIALAIELAAPRIKVLSLAQLTQRLDDRLKLLTGGSRTALPRQQTLRALIGWSYDLLEESERSMLRQASLFRGTWTLEAAEAAWHDEAIPDGDSFDAVAALVDKSLIVAAASGDEQRYRLLESTRAFALERLVESGEREAVAARHCRYYADLARNVGESYWRTDGDIWTSSVRLDIENYRSAINWGLAEGETEAAAAIVGALRSLWDRTARREGRALVAAASSAVDERVSTGVRGRLLVAAGILAERAEAEEEAASQALGLLESKEDAIPIVEALLILAGAAGNSGNLTEALASFERALPIARSGNLPRLLGSTLSSAAYYRACNGDGVGARAYFDEATQIIRRCNDLPALARLNVIRAELCFAEGDVADALTCGREAEGIYRKRKDEGSFFCTTLLNVTAYLLASEDLPEAWRIAREALELALRRDDAFCVAVAVAHLARVAAECGDVVHAARLLGFVDASYARFGSVREPTEKQSYDRTIEFVRAALPQERIADLMRQGASFDRDTAAAEATSIPEPPALGTAPA